MRAAPSRARPARPSAAASLRTSQRAPATAGAHRPGRFSWAPAFAATVATSILLFSTPLRAETAFSASVASDDRFRGDSASGNRPVGTVSIGYDDVRGPYAGASLTL